MYGDKIREKNKLYPMVDDEAKRNLVMFQAKESLRTRDDAVEMILHKAPNMGGPGRSDKEATGRP